MQEADRAQVGGGRLDRPKDNWLPDLSLCVAPHNGVCLMARFGRLCFSQATS